MLNSKTNIVSRLTRPLRPLACAVMASFATESSLADLHAPETSSPLTTTNTSTTHASKRLLSPQVGDLVPNFSIRDAKGNPVDLYALLGKGYIVILDFWATWCGPCKAEMPNLMETVKKHQQQKIQNASKGVQLVSICEGSEKSAWTEAISTYHMVGRQCLDTNGSIQELFGVHSYPTSFIIVKDGKNPGGKIIAMNLRGADLDKFIESYKKLGNSAFVIPAKIPRLEPGDLAPDFSLPDFKTNNFTLSTLQQSNTYALVMFYAGRVELVRLDLPKVIAIADKFADRRFDVLAVSEAVRLPQESKANIDNWKLLYRSEVLRFGLNLSPNIHNLLDRYQTTIEAFKVDLLPSYILLDPRRRVVGTYVSDELLPGGKLEMDLKALQLPMRN